jgi:SAM-dependent methyltransferase
MTEITSQAWDAYWQHYEPPDYINYTPELVNTIQAHVNLAQTRVLEIGVGTGGNSSLLGQRGAQVIVLDLSALALARTRRTAQQFGVQLLSVLADARQLPFASGSFDLIFHQGFLEHFRGPAPLVEEQRRILCNGGHLLVDVPQRYNLYTLYKHRLIKKGRWPYGGWEREFSYTELCNLLKANGFSIITAYGRGYFPRPFEMLHNLPNAEMKVLKHRIIPEHWWKPYRQLWNRFERSALGINTLQAVGVLARAI